MSQQLAEFTAFEESLCGNTQPNMPRGLPMMVDIDDGGAQCERPPPFLRDPREDSAAAAESGGGAAMGGGMHSSASFRRQSSFSLSFKRKMSMMLPGSFQGNDFDNEDQLLEAPNHRGATSATGFLRFLTEEGMGKMRAAWGSRCVTAGQFVDLVEPILRESATDFFDELGGRKSDVWTAEGWISSVQRAALQLGHHNDSKSNNGRRKTSAAGSGGAALPRLATQTLSSSPPVSRQTNVNSAITPPSTVDLFSPVRNRKDIVDGRSGAAAEDNKPFAAIFGDSDDDDDNNEMDAFDGGGDNKRAPRLSRLASTQSIRAFLGNHNASPSSEVGPTTGDGYNGFSSSALPPPMSPLPNSNSNNNNRARSSPKSFIGIPHEQQQVVDRQQQVSSRGSLDANEDSVLVEEGLLNFLSSTGLAKPPPSLATASLQQFLSPSSTSTQPFVSAGRRATGTFSGGGPPGRRASGFFSPPAAAGGGGRRNSGGGESELRQYLRNLFAYIDHRRTHKMQWDVFSSFLVNGITVGSGGGGAFRSSANSGGEPPSTGKKDNRGSPETSPRRSDTADDDDEDDEDDDNHAADSEEEATKALYQYKVTTEVPLPTSGSSSSTSLATIGGGGVISDGEGTPGMSGNIGSSSTAAPACKRDWVLKMRYLEDIDKILVVMKYSITFMDPYTLPGGLGVVGSTSAGTGGDGGGRPLSSSMKLHNSANSTMGATMTASSSNSVIGTPSPSCLPMHIIPSSSRISTALFLPDPFWAMVVFDTDRGVSSVAVWQYQIAPARPPELSLKSKLFPTCSDSCMITCCLYTKPVTDAERLGLESAKTLLECVLLLGTRDGRVMSLTVVKNNTNASKPTYSHRPPVEISKHNDVVTTMLHLQHSGCICTASLDSTVRILERKKHEYKVRGTLRFHKLGVTSLAYARDSLTLFTSGHDGLVAAWSENQWSSPSYILRDHNHPPKGSIISIQCIPQTNVVAAFDSGGMLRFYDTRDRRVVFDLSIVDPQLIAAGIVKREDLRKDADEGSAHTTAVLGTSGTMNTRRTAGIGIFSSMCFTGALHRQFLFAGSHMYIAIASEELKRNPLCTYDHHRSIVHASLSSVFGLVTTSNAEITLWSLKNGMPDTRHRNVTASAITAVTCRPTTDIILLGLASGDITAVQTSTGTILQQYKCHDQTIAGLSLHPTKPILISACRGVEGLLCLWHDDRLLSMRSAPNVQNSLTESVHPQQVIPLTAVHPAIFLSFDPSGSVIAAASPQRIVFYAQHPKFHRWVDVRSIHHGNLTEMNAFAWLDTRPRDVVSTPPAAGGGGVGGAELLMETSTLRPPPRSALCSTRSTQSSIDGWT
ncbi:WD40 repeat-containing protein, putative [Bodo saltans]|uniref:WD40 repeat-containing protein, putative n=1 Tax=Bodo saltans TaxID=75058 RepID=A0A0S4JBB7_BODSA|nr:WD40 repeat-containing protein, putative [Bodo saltans]|eukprot:CUG87558.1 WD40 repeat-containing protein, putative [Bodo saltans]